MDELAGIPLGTIGISSGWALFGLLSFLIVRAFVRGDAVPRRILEDALHDRDEWRAAHRISESARVESATHTTVQAEAARTMSQLMNEIQDRIGPGRGYHDSGGSRHEQEESL